MFHEGREEAQLELDSIQHINERCLESAIGPGTKRANFGLVSVSFTEQASGMYGNND